MTDDEALARLCELAGILSAYRDNFGRRHALSSDTARGILNALGIAYMSSAEVRASLAGLEEEPWREALPPVVVIREGESGSSELHLPAGLPARKSSVFPSRAARRPSSAVRPNARLSLAAAAGCADSQAW